MGIGPISVRRPNRISMASSLSAGGPGFARVSNAASHTQLLHRVKGAPHRKAWIKSQCANAVACSSVCRRKCVQKSMRNLRQLCAPSRPPHWKPTSSFLPPGVAYVTRPPRQESAGQCAEVRKELVRPRTRRRDQGPSLTPRLLRQRGPDPPTLKAPSSRTIHGRRRFRSPH